MAPYFPAPDSLFSLSPVQKVGLPVLGTLATLSLISTFSLLVWITYRLISWRSHYKAYVGYNQYVLLIYNLLLADLQQATAFLISFHWVQQGQIVAPTSACFAQGWLLHIGDVSSGSFVLAIAIHTWLGVVKGYKMSYLPFVGCIIGIWIFSVLMASLGPILYHNRFFARAGSWCWVSVRYEDDRLWLHYIWIFIYEFGTILIYCHIFFHLRGRLSNIVSHDQATTNKLKKSTQYMVLYPLVYVVLTLPLAVGRMVTMGGSNLPDAYYLVAGCLLTSCGLLDALLYTLTRRVLVSNELTDPTRRTATRGGNSQGPTKLTTHHTGWDIASFDNRNVDAINHSVTITGGNRRSRVIEPPRGREHARHIPITTKSDSQTALREPSPTGSMDSMIKPKSERGMELSELSAITVTVEHKIDVTEAQSEPRGSSSSLQSNDTIQKSPVSSDSTSLYKEHL